MVFDKLSNFLILPLYYFIHHNIFFGFIHKYFIKTFRFKKFKFFLNIENIPLSNYSSFLFNTYEYNDRKLIERNINDKNHCIIIGGGLGLFPAFRTGIPKIKYLFLKLIRKFLRI